MTGSEAPSVTVVVPALDEADHIGTCIDAIGAQDWPLDDLEVLVVDGGSCDETVPRATAALARHGFARTVVLHAVGGTPANLNRGLAAADGGVLCRVDARSLVPSAYVRSCVEVLRSRPEVAVVGGGQRALARDGTARSVGIARALNNRWTTGFSKYRRGGLSGVSDTVYLGSFRVDQLRAVGGWDERLGTNQDFDLNRRLAAVGVVWFVGGLDVGYVPRASHGQLFRQYRRFGAWKVRYWRLTGDRPRPRQVAALAVAPSAVVLLALWARWRGPARWVAAGGVLTAATMVEQRGTTGPPADVRGRVASLAATACIGTGWSVGASGALAGRRST